MRWNIARLMILVLVAAFCCAPLARPTPLWAGMVMMVAVLVLAVAVLGAIFARGLVRAFWTGFALFGWGFLLLHQGPWFEDHLGPFLASTALLDLLHAEFQSTASNCVPVLAESPRLRFVAPGNPGSPSIARSLARPVGSVDRRSTPLHRFSASATVG